MRCLVYPGDGYIAQNVSICLERAGHDVVDWHNQGSQPSEAAWLAGLHQADAVFHVLHGHELHAKASVLQLLKTVTLAAPATFVGISTPLTWAATPAPAVSQIAQAIEVSSAAATEQQINAQSDGAVIVLPSAVLTQKDVASRRPAAAALQTYHLEQLILRCNRPGRLAAYVICPGVLYGAGEDDTQLHSLWQTAWEGKQPLTVYGSGNNRLPTLHVADLAAYAEAVVLQQPAARYLLAADSEIVTQAELVAAIGHLLGNKQTQTLSGEAVLLQPPASPLLLLDLPLSPSPLPQAAELVRCCPNGLLANLPAVLQQMLHSRALTPLRILIRGPPASGKSHVAGRLAQLYGVPHISIPTILAELPLMDAETQKACNAQLVSKEGRIAPQLMAHILQHLLARDPAAINHGWVLEGWPKNLAAARLMTCSSGPEGGKQGDRAANRRATGAPIKDKKKSQSGAAPASTGSSCKEVADGSSAKTRRMTTAGEEPSLTDCGISLQNPELLPHVLIELDVPEDELLRRVRALAAAEAAAAAAAVAAAAASQPNSTGPGKGAAAGTAGKKPVSAGKKDPGPAASAGPAGTTALPSHNNEKDFARRMELYKQILQEDAADLTAKRSAILSALQAASQASNPSPHESPGRSGRITDRGASSTKGAATAVPAADFTIPPDVKLPEVGGYAAYFVEAGAKYVRVRNSCNEAAMAATAALVTTPRSQQQHVPLPDLEQQLIDAIGPPHNYTGLPVAAAAPGKQDVLQPGTMAGVIVSNAVGAAAAGAGNASAMTNPAPSLKFPASIAKGTATRGLTLPDIDEVLAIAEALAAEQSHQQQQRLQTAARPLAANLMGGVMPALMAGLVKVALSRPKDPCQVIADELLKAAESLGASYIDPYDDPAYAIQLAKVEAKAAREAARAAAAAAKAARELVAAAAAQQEAEAAAAAATLTASASAASMGAYGTPSATVPAMDTTGPAAGGASQPPTRPGSAVSGSKSVRSPVKTSAPLSAGSGRSEKSAASVKAR